MSFGSQLKKLCAERDALTARQQSGVLISNDEIEGLTAKICKVHQAMSEHPPEFLRHDALLTRLDEIEAKLDWLIERFKG
jgi:hypothetical protein